VEYQVDLGTSWLNLNKHPLNCVTQLSAGSKTPSLKMPKENVHYFGFPIELELETEKKNEEYPKLYFQINSYDYWDRRRVEGYCYLTVPTFSGKLTYSTITFN
jgi:hypothetical protein